MPLSQQPQPLRSDEFPDGLPGLSEKDTARVTSANASYKAMVDLVVMLIQWGVSVSIENPANSLFWKTSWIQALRQQFPGHETLLDHCMHGGSRDKASKFWAHNPLDPDNNMLSSLGIRCDGNHMHKSWKPTLENVKFVFPTKEEAAYPEILCERSASIFLRWAKQRNLQGPQTLQQRLEADADIGKRQLFTGQPRTKTLLQAVSEFGSFRSAAIPLNCNSIQSVSHQLPKGSKPTSRFLQRGFARDVFLQQHANQPILHQDLCPGDDFEVVVFGIPRSPTEFLSAAKQCGYPRGHLVRTSKELADAVVANLSWRDHELFAHRATVFKSWLKKAEELKHEEAKRHAGLPQHLQRILSKKKLLLWKHILVSLDYGDTKIVDEMISGFSLTGWAEESGVFDKKVRQADMTVEQLRGVSLGLNSAVVGSLKNSDWSALGDEAVKETQAEVDKGWLSKCDKVDMRKHVVAKRFAISQKNKTRLIDDFSICGVTETVGLPERLRVESVDQVVTILLSMLNLKAGVSKLPWVGRTFDLKSAYKQFGVSENEVERLKVAVKTGMDQVEIFNVLALPFGATGSVVAFLRIAASIAYIGTKALFICWSSFFDDYTSLCPERLAENTQFYIEGLFRLLGVDFAETGDKAPPFSVAFRSLGLQFDLSRIDSGSFTLGHTTSRREELCEQITALLEQQDQMVNPKDLERLHGRLVWFNAFVFGRTLKAAVTVVSRYSRFNSRRIALDSELRLALQTLLKELEQTEPVVVNKALTTTWTIYTDGAYEPEGTIKASIGAVLVNEDGLPVECFGVALDEELLQEFLGQSDRPIYELEILPVLVALRLWQQHLMSKQVVFYLDTDAARSAFVRAGASTKIGDAMVQNFLCLEKRLRILPWFARVPSASNPADDASRLVFNVPWFLGVPRCEVVLPARLAQWGI